jgi:histidine triad (HIT) family protein
MNNDCIFCKIVAKEIPSTKVYEDEDFVSFLDIHPVVNGHLLLIPREHYEWIHEVPDPMTGKIFITTKKLINTMRKGLPCDYVQVVVVGEGVPHFHIHLIPRFIGDKPDSDPTHEYTSIQEAEEYARKIKSAL